jgi:hypothetical protein
MSQVAIERSLCYTGHIADSSAFEEGNCSMRFCKRCRELGYFCAACTVAFFVSGHDPHTHEDQKQAPPREVRAVTVVASTSANMAVTDWIVVPGTSKRFRIPPST